LTDIRFTPPVADVTPAASAEPSRAALDALKRIRRAAVAGVVSTVLTLGLTLLGMTAHRVGGYTSANFLDVALMAGLTFGVWRRSRVCAFLLLLYFIASKGLQFFAPGSPMPGGGMIVTTGLFLWYYFNGAIGTLDWHRQRRLGRA
jgi:serine/threonine-protein kinase